MTLYFIIYGKARTIIFQLAKYRALIERCGPHLRELSFAAIGDHIGDQWTKMRNLRHLRFDACVSSVTLRAVADNLTRLKSIHISNIVNNRL